MSANQITVFFYGLFMDETILASKGIHAESPATGYVDGFALHIGERATLLPDPNGRAYGVVMKLAREDATKLYSEPSVADYIAEPVVVTLPGDIRVEAVCYNLPADKLAGANPDYAAALLELATRLSLPDSYLAHIKTLG